MPLPKATGKSKKVNKLLLEKFRDAIIPVNDIQTGEIDAILVADKNTTNIFTENAADKIYRVLIEKMHEGAVTVSTDGIILYCNAAFAAMVKQPLQKIAGSRFNRFIGVASRQHFDDLCMNSGQHPAGEQFFLQTTKTCRLPVLISINAIPAGTAMVKSIILTDISLQIQQQEALQQKTDLLEQNNRRLDNANKNLISFSHVSSHDLQEPLRKIQNFISRLVLDEAGHLSENGRRYLDGIASTAMRMKLLIEDLLDYAQAGHIERKFEKTSLASMVNEVEKDLTEKLIAKMGSIDTGHLGSANIIPFQFRQLLLNLIGNSLKFSSTDRKLHIKISSRNIKMRSEFTPAPKLKSIYCHIIYIDNGIGFA
ncbi:MAG: histidine kinase dimerization/phospho-acceptor domain-containing protein, partial [Bacteroidota bacterium]